MAEAIGSAFSQGTMVTLFVAMMMIIVEYLSVLTRGAFQRALTRSRWVQYLAAVLLGATPGCLGAFTVVALYAHRSMSFGAVVGTMIATSGDEAFVMLALFPKTALALSVGLAALGLVAAAVTDLLLGKRALSGMCSDLVIHEEEACRCFPGREIVTQWRRPNPARAVLLVAIVAYLGAVALGPLGPAEWNWVRVTLILVGLSGGFVIGTVPDHFLVEHLWRHLALRHIPRIFAWTVSVLVAVAVLDQLVELEALVRGNRWAVLAVAAGLGVIPESGPHLIWVGLFHDGVIPLSILVASSIVQDGHAMLPVLAESRRQFLGIKAVNLLIGLCVGAVLLGLGY
jgi:hypothetical protein